MSWRVKQKTITYSQSTFLKSQISSGQYKILCILVSAITQHYHPKRTLNTHIIAVYEKNTIQTEANLKSSWHHKMFYNKLPGLVSFHNNFWLFCSFLVATKAVKEAPSKYKFCSCRFSNGWYMHGELSNHQETFQNLDCYYLPEAVTRPTHLDTWSS